MAIRGWHRLTGSRGAAVVEFAVILPLLLLLVFGIIEFGVLLFDQAILTNASREGARVGILFRPASESGARPAAITAAVNGYLGDHLITFGEPGPATVTTTPADAAGLGAGDYLTVSVGYHYQFLLVPAFITDLTDGLTLQAETTMRAE